MTGVLEGEVSREHGQYHLTEGGEGVIQARARDSQAGQQPPESRGEGLGQASPLQNWERIHFCFSWLVHGALLWKHHRGAGSKDTGPTPPPQGNSWSG